MIMAIPSMFLGMFLFSYVYGDPLGLILLMSLLIGVFGIGYLAGKKDKENEMEKRKNDDRQ